VSFQNPLIAKWQAGEPTLGGWVTTPEPAIAEYLASVGFDEVCADQQHSTLDVETLGAMFAAIEARGSVPTTRVAVNDYTLIGKSLDLGALAVIVPMVNNRAEAERAVSAFRYPPRGTRSAGPLRAMWSMGSDPVDLDKAACVLMIETKDGLANLDEIAATPGVDALYVGPGDLALGLGMSWDSSRWSPSEAEAHASAIERIRRAAVRNGIAPGIHVGDGATSARYIEQGFQMLTVASDLGLITVFGAPELALARAAVPPGRRR
jgi:4-hydroxy-2-oxoheptanedioate aldolase